MSPKDTVRRQVIFLVSEYKTSSGLLNMIKFKYSISKPRTHREVNEGLGRHARQPKSQDIWCPILATWYQLLWEINKLLYKTITYTLHLYSAGQFLEGSPISIRVGNASDHWSNSVGKRRLVLHHYFRTPTPTGIKVQGAGGLPHKVKQGWGDGGQLAHSFIPMYQVR